MRLDAARHPVRGDLADLDLAERVFAPHYAQAHPYRALEAATIREHADHDAEARGELRPGDAFHVLDISGGWAWGHGDAEGSVGYVPRDAVAPA